MSRRLDASARCGMYERRAWHPSGTWLHMTDGQSAFFGRPTASSPPSGNKAGDLLLRVVSFLLGWLSGRKEGAITHN